MKKMVAVLALAAVCACAVFAGGSSEKGKSETLTLRWSTYYTTQDRAKGWPTIIQQYEAKNPNVKIELSAGANGYDETLRTQISAGMAPDIIGIQHTRFLDYAEKGLLVDLTADFKNAGYDKSLYGLCLGWGEYGGKILGIPDNPAPIEWFYNAKIFNDLGLSEPKTKQELYAACEKIKAAGYIPIMWGDQDTWTGTAVLGMITAQTMGLDPVYAASKSGDWNIAGLKEALNIVKELKDKGYIDPMMTGVDYNTSEEMFVKGKVAIFPMGSWAISQIEANKPSDFQYSVFKDAVKFVDKPIGVWSASGGQIHSLTASSKSIDAAKAFLLSVFSKDSQLIAAKEGNMMSPRPDVNGIFDTAVSKLALGHLEETNKHSGMLIDYLPIKVMDNLGMGIQQVINGSETVDKILATLAK